VDYLIFSSSDGAVLFLTPSIASVLGASVTGLLATHIDKLVHPEDLPKLKSPAMNNDSALGAGVLLRLSSQPDCWRSVKVFPEVLVGHAENLMILSIESVHDAEKGNSKECESLPSVFTSEGIASQIVHDLRNPLAVIQEALFLLKDVEPKEAELQKCIQWIEKSTANILRIVHSIRKNPTGSAPLY